MTSPYTLNHIMTEMDMAGKGSSSSISLPSSKSSRNELDSIFDKIHKSSSPVVSSVSSESDETKDPNVKRVNGILIKIEKQTELVAQNIVLRIRYLSSPLRLFLKLYIMNMDENTKRLFHSSLKVSAAVKEDIFADWQPSDSLGIFILVKMYNMYKNLFPNIMDQTQFMKLLKPSVTSELNPFDKQIAFYLFNQVMNKETAYHPNGEVNIEDAYIHGWFDKFLKNDKDDLEEVGVPYEDVLLHLKNRIAFDINVYASIVFKKPVQYKYIDGSGKPAKAQYNPEELIHQMVQELEKFKLPIPNPDGNQASYADQLRYWLTTDDPTENKKRHHHNRGGRKKLRK